jgi:GAF domain-containing protein
VLAAICDAVCAATGGTSAWVVEVVGERLRVAASTGAGAALARGRSVDVSGTVGYVAASGQPMAITPREGDAHLTGGLLGLLDLEPAAVMAVPCHDDGEVVGVLEVIDERQGARFSFEDVELATLLAGVAGPAISHRTGATAAPSPEVLTAQLRSLAADSPGRYAQVALVVQQLLATV